MKFIQNNIIYFILYVFVFPKFTKCDQNIVQNGTKTILQRSDNYYYRHSCTYDWIDQCGSSTNMICSNFQCKCKLNYIWDSFHQKCLKMCDYTNKYSCSAFNNRYCDSVSDKCYCKIGYKEESGSDDCVKIIECLKSSDCSYPKLYCNYDNNKCECYAFQTYNKAKNICEYETYTETWRYYLWFLLLIPIMIIASIIYCICRRNRVIPGALIISNNRVITPTYPQQAFPHQAYPPPPPPYTEVAVNTYRY